MHQGIGNELEMDRKRIVKETDMERTGHIGARGEML